jgi:hypothetical protein
MWEEKRSATRQAWPNPRDRKIHDNRRGVWIQPKSVTSTGQILNVPLYRVNLELYTQMKLGYILREFSTFTFIYLYKCSNTLSFARKNREKSYCKSTAKSEWVLSLIITFNNKYRKCVMFYL